MQVQALVSIITPCEYWVFLSSIMLTMWVIFGFMVCCSCGGLVGGPFASENGGVKIPGVRVNLSAAAVLVWGLASGHAVLVSPEVFEDLPGAHWVAVVGEGAGSACVVGAGDHGLGSNHG
jgi:hypothetical protein